MPHKKHIAFSLAAGLLIASCQSPSADAQSQDLPDLYKVSWKVCDFAEIINLQVVKAECKDSSMLLWGPIGQSKFEKSRTHIGGINYHLFIKSKGCLMTGVPKTEDFYNMGRFYAGPIDKENSLSPPTATVKSEKLSKKQTQQEIKKVTAYLEGRAQLPQMIVDSSDCNSLAEWEKKPYH